MQEIPEKSVIMEAERNNSCGKEWFPLFTAAATSEKRRA